jgi:chromosome segregation ATPase
VGFLSKIVEDFKNDWAAAGEELGVADRRQRDRERRRRDAADPVKTPTAASEDDKKLLEQAAVEIEKITAERDKLAAERDQLQVEHDKLAAERTDDKKLLDQLAAKLEEVEAERDKLAAERDQAQAELTNNKDIIDALAEQAEQWQAERDQLMDVFKIPGMKQLLAKNYPPDKPGATEAVKRAFEDYLKKINAAYDLIKRDDRAKKSDDAA